MKTSKMLYQNKWCKIIENAYISCYGQLSGQYLGNIETPLAYDVDYSNIPELLLNAEQFIIDNRNVKVSIW